MNSILYNTLLKIPFRSSSRVITLDEIGDLQTRFGSLISTWYLDILRRFPLIDAQFERSRPVGDIPVQLALAWMSPMHVLQEAYEAVPGCVAINYGYIPVATCLMGSGDPYFIRCADGDDPPLVEIYHDAVSDEVGLRDEAIWVVAPTLSEFFAQATLR